MSRWERAERSRAVEPQVDLENDDALVASIRGGNLSGLGVLFDRHGEDVHRLLGRLGIDARDADDLVQQTFLDVIDASARFHAGSPVRPWLYGIAVMAVRRHRRSVGRMFARLRTWTAARVEQEVATPAEEFDRREDARRGQRALAMLSTKKRDAFVLVALEEMSGEEAAKILEVPIATVWTRVHHARRELAELLGARR